MNLNSNFLSLKKNLKKDFTGFKSLKVALLGDSSTQFLRQSIRGSGYNAGLNLDIYEADYDQIDQEIFDVTSRLYDHQSDFVLIFQSVQKLKLKFYNLDQIDRKNFASIQISHIKHQVETLTEKSNARVVYANFIEVNDGVFGNFSNKAESSFLFQLRKLNYEMMIYSAENQNLYINDLSILNSRIGYNSSFDAKLYVTSAITQSPDFSATVAENTIDIICSLIGRIRKCLILDLDNTTWGGIIGDDGIDKIEIGNLGIGRAFTELQLWVRELQRRGIILTICSKNTESLAKEPFEKHPDMVLKLDDISVFMANWETKVDNIRHIQAILNIGFDSMVFLDDNPFEREMVKQELPDVTVPELPADPSSYLDCLSNLNLFETSSFTPEDGARTRQYQDEAKRMSVKKQYNSEANYLRSLSMKSKVKPFNNFLVPRVAQLTQRSNQFNLRTKRYNEQDISSMVRNDGIFTTLSFELEDKFGDYGLISAIILEKTDKSLFIDTWVMSCRVLKRGMESFILNQIVEVARKNGISQLYGEYIPTSKNIIVENLFETLGFEKSGAFWYLNIETFKPLETYIYAEH
jgi:FkbH-like protein